MEIAELGLSLEVLSLARLRPENRYGNLDLAILPMAEQEAETGRMGQPRCLYLDWKPLKLIDYLDQLLVLPQQQRLEDPPHATA